MHDHDDHPAASEETPDPGGPDESGPDAGTLISGAGIAVAAAALAATAPAAAAVAPAAGAPATTPAPVTQRQQQQGPGAQKLARLCDGRTGGICRTPPWSEAHLTFDAVLIGRFVRETWPQVEDVGGWRPSDPYPDHPSGKAVDIMMPNGGSGKDRKLGDEIAAYFQEHAREFGVDYILWRQQQWSADSGNKRWKGMADRGSPTANHMDHVHITVHGDKSTIARELIAELSTPGEASAPDAEPATDALIPTVDPDQTTRSVVVSLFDENRRG